MTSHSSTAMFPRFCIVLYLALHGADLNAQTISTKIRFVSCKVNSPSDFSYFHEGKRVDLKGVNETIRSKPIAYKGPPILSLFPVTSADKPGQTPQPVANIPIPATVKFPLVILIPNPDGPTPAYSGIVFDDDPSEFPFSSYSVVNLSRQKIALEIGEKQVVIEPGKYSLSTTGDKVINFRISIPKGENSKWRIIYDNFFQNWPEDRNLFFISDMEKNGNPHLEVTSLRENKTAWQSVQQPKSDPLPTAE